MDRLKVQLIIRLNRNKAHVLAFDGLGDGLRIDEIVLVRLHEGLHKLSCDQTNIVPLLPQRTSSCGCGDQYRATGPALVQPANDRIRALASSEGAILVDLYQALGGVPGPYIDTDGLHPTLQGHELIASTFFGSITSRLEISGTTTMLQLGR